MSTPLDGVMPGDCAPSSIDVGLVVFIYAVACASVVWEAVITFSAI